MIFVKLLSLLVILLSSFGQFSGGGQQAIPVTGTVETYSNSTLRTILPLDVFSLSVVNRNAKQVVGVYISDLFAYPVLQQPNGKPAYVSSENNIVTQFSVTKKFGSTGLIAHNYLAGALFSEINQNQEIVIIYGDGSQVNYTVTEVRKYQALSPTSPYSSFINLDDPDRTISYKELFYETYALEGKLILQTCIAKGNSDSWGRLFIIAEIPDVDPS
ncbi:MAG: hypothetical protein FD147_903 [Chloroflexi bacterium]|nr:MAG: hypothetical protein FD147_903 [Chloroflexota bacterium]